MAFEFGSPPQWWQESKTWKQKNPNQQQQKEKCGSKPVLLVEGPGSKWWNALLSVSTAPDCRAVTFAGPDSSVRVYRLAMGWGIAETGLPAVCLSIWG